MWLPHLPKLLLQHDSSPYIENLGEELIRAAAAGRLESCIHPTGLDLALALGQRLVVVRNLQDDSGGALRFVTATDAPECITALAWLFSPARAPDDCILLGTSTGFLQLHAADGALLHRQELHDKAVTSITVRWSGSGLDPEDSTEDVTVGFQDAVVRLPSLDVWSVMRWHQRTKAAGSWWGAGAAHHLTPAKWEFRNLGPRACCAFCGPAAVALYTVLTRRHAPAQLLLFTAGLDPPLASFHVEEGATPGLLSLVSSLAKSYLPGSGLRRSGHVAAPAAHAADADGKRKKRERIPGTPLSQEAGVWDDQRAVTSVALSPCCRWAACCDSLGRVLLVDVGSTLVLRVLKGYRDAQAAWLVAPELPDGERGKRGGQNEPLLVVYAPRRGAVEIWRPHLGLRVGSLPAPTHGLLLQQPAMPVPAAGVAAGRRFQPNAVWMLDVAGLQLKELTEEVREVSRRPGAAAGPAPTGAEMQTAL